MANQLKRILILHASAGHGHLKAAKAIESSLKSQYPESTIETHDALDFFPGWIKFLYVGSYVWMINKAPFIWGFFYWITDCKLWFFWTALKRRIFNGMFSGRLVQRIRDTNPHVIVSTHFMPAEICAHLLKNNRIQSKCVTVVTDFLVHRFWVFKETHLYMVASDMTRDALVDLGVKRGAIQVTGIPVHPKFENETNRAKTHQSLNLDEDKFTLLFTPGVVGASALYRIVSSVCRKRDVQAIVVSGNNPGLQKKMSRLTKKYSNLAVLGFVNNMHELMDACDVIVGKAGGLTVSESLTKRKPLFVLSPVPGQETNNADLLSRKGALYWVQHSSHLQKIIRHYMADQELRTQISNGIEAVVNSHSAHQAAQLIFEMASLPRSGN